MATLTAYLTAMLEKLIEYKESIDAAASLLGVIGIPIAVLIFLHEKKLERRQREDGTYLQVHAQYLDYLKLCLEHPNIDVWENEIDDPKLNENNTIDPETLRAQSIVHSYFISMAEQAFIVYRSTSPDQKKRQWVGWENYITEYFRRKSFQDSWKSLGQQFDDDFLKFMESCKAKAMMPTKPSGP